MNAIRMVEGVLESTLAGVVPWRRDGSVYTADNGRGRTMTFDGHHLDLGGAIIDACDAGGLMAALRMAVAESESIANAGREPGFGNRLLEALAHCRDWTRSASLETSAYAGHALGCDVEVYTVEGVDKVRFIVKSGTRTLMFERPRNGLADRVLDAAEAEFVGDGPPDDVDDVIKTLEEMLRGGSVDDFIDALLS